MALAFRALLVAALVALASAAVLRVAPRASSGHTEVKNSTGQNSTDQNSTDHQITALRAKLGQIATGLTKMVAPSGLLNNAKVATQLQAFAGEIRHILNETEGSKDSVKSLKQLENAQASVQGLMKDLTVQQMRIMKQGDDEEQSLLLGVLMTKQKKSLADQMKVLTDDEFVHLPVVAAILKTRDTKTPLFQQVAAYLDAHKAPAKAAQDQAETPKKLRGNATGKPDVTPIVQALQVHLKRLVDSDKRRAKAHAEEIIDLEAAAAKAAKKKPALGHKIDRMKKAEDRKYAKEEAVARHDIQSMEGAIAAIQKGDVSALRKASDALQTSLESKESKSAGFLYLIQLAHKLEHRSCPYCAAQCVEKCHVAGRTYVDCLTECADAGK